MGKVINFIDSQRKNYILTNSDIGDAVSISTSELDISNINIGNVKTVLSEDNYNLSELCTSPNVNKWAWKKPGILNSMDSFNLVVTPPYKLGDFAGYNHHAYTPYITISPLNYPFSANGQVLPIVVGVDLSETDLTEDGNITHLYAKIDSTYYSLELEPTMFQRDIQFNYTTVGTSSYSKTVYLFLGWEGNKEKIPFPTPSVILNLNYSPQAQLGNVLINTTGLDLNYNYSAFIINKTLTGANYSFQIRVQRSNQDTTEYYNDYWNVKELLNNNQVQTNVNINSTAGYTTISGTLPYLPTNGNVINFELAAY